MNRKHIFTFVTSVGAALLLILGLNKLLSLSPITPQQQTSLTVSAAISLTESLQEIKQLYLRSQPNVSISYNFGASGALQQQIEQGETIDVFISAASKQMDSLQQKKLLIPETRQNLLTNRLVLITPINAVNLSSFRDLTGSQVRRIAVGEPRTVPAGQYAREVLTNLRIIDRVQQKLVYANNVRQVLTYVETGNVDAGIVYVTDVRKSNHVRVVATAPPNLHSPIVYPIAVLKNSKNVAAAREFVQFISSDTGRIMFEKYGFTMAKRSNRIQDSGVRSQNSV